MNYSSPAYKRGVHFWVYGLIFGPLMVLALFAVVGCGIGYLLGQPKCSINSFSDAYSVVWAMVMAAAIFSFVAFVIGYLTESFTGRLWIWRILGGGISLACMTVGYFAWRQVMANGVPITWVHYALASFVIAMIAAGIGIIFQSRELARSRL